MAEDDLIFDRSDPEPTDLVAAPGDEIRPNLIELGTGIFAFTHPEPRFGNSNLGLIIDRDGLTVVDTGSTPVRGKVLRSEVEALTSTLELPLKRVIVTSSRVPFTGGSALFWRAGFYGSEAASDELDQPVNHVALRALLPHLAPAFHDGFETRPVTHTITEPAWLTDAAKVLVVPGESSANVALLAPGADTLFLGALGSFGVTPLAFVGDPLRWADSLDELAAAARTFVPGHGPIGGRGDVADLARYLRACAAAEGNLDGLASGPWEEWTDRDFDAVNIERAHRLARGDDRIPQAMFELLGLA